MNDNLEGSEAESTPNQESENPSGKKFFKKKKAAESDSKHNVPVVPIIIGVTVFIAICIGIFGVITIFKNLDYMRPAKNICKIYNDRESDISKVYSLIYDEPDKSAYDEAYKILANSDMYYKEYAQLSQSLEDYYRDNAAESGSDIKMIFDTTGDKHKMDEAELAIVYKEFEKDTDYYQNILDSLDNMGKDDWQKLSDNLGISLNKAKKIGSILKERCEKYTKYTIDSGYYITGRFVLVDKSKNTVAKTDKLTLSVIRLNGNWYLLDGKAEGIMLATGSDTLAYTDMLFKIYEENIR